MKTRKIILGLTTVLGLTILLSACKKDTSSPAGNTGMGVKIEAVNTSFQIPFQSANGAPIPATELASVNWSTAQMWISRVTFEARPQSGLSGTTGISSPLEQELTINGPMMVDLFDLSSSPLGKFSLSKGTYSEIEIRAFGTKADAGDNPVLYLAGTYTSASGKELPLVLNVTDDIVLSAEKLNVTINRDIPDFSPIVQVFLDKMFTNVLPSMLKDPQLTDGTIIISSSSNTDVYNVIVKDLQRASEWEFADSQKAFSR